MLWFGSHPWGRRPSGSKRGGELSRQWAGGRHTQGWPGQGSGIGGESGEESTGDSYPDQLAGGLWRADPCTQPRGHTPYQYQIMTNGEG